MPSVPSAFRDRAISRNWIAKFAAKSSYTASCGASSQAISSMFWQNSATQAVPSACSRYPPRRQRRAAIEDTDIVEPEKPALVEIVAGAVLAVHPPAIIAAELAKDPLQKIEVGSTAQRLLHTEQKN